MSYIGQAPIDEFIATPTKDSFTGDGSTTAFDLAASVAAGGINALEVYVDNVRQEPGSGKAFTVGVDGSGDLKRITFTAAPASSAAIYVLNPLTNTTFFSCRSLTSHCGLSSRRSGSTSLKFIYVRGQDWEVRRLQKL